MKQLITLSALCIAAGSSAITLGQVDTFEDGTTMGWGHPQTHQPENISTGGPRGVDDNYLRFAGGLVGWPQHLAMFNQTQWVGDWIAAGVTVVEAHVKNEGPDTVNLRAVWHGQQLSRWTSTVAVSVPPDNKWYKVAFPCRESDLTNALITGETYAQAMSNVERFMIRHDAGSPSSGGSPVTAAIGIDNVEASNKADYEPYDLIPTRGVRTGSLYDVLFSDDLRNTWRPGITFTTAQAPVEFRVVSFAPTLTNPTSMSFNLEGHATAPVIRRQFELYNYNTNTWNVVSVYANSATSDELITVSVAPANYINPTDGKMEARISYKSFGPVFVYPWQARQDRIFFRLTP